MSGLTKFVLVKQALASYSFIRISYNLRKNCVACLPKGIEDLIVRKQSSLPYPALKVNDISQHDELHKEQFKDLIHTIEQLGILNHAPLQSLDKSEATQDIVAVHKQDSVKPHLAIKRSISDSLKQLYADVQKCSKFMQKVNSVSRLTETLAVEDKQRQKLFNSDMKAFTQAAITGGMLRQAYSAVTVPYINRQTRRSTEVNSFPLKMKDRVVTEVDIYNMLMAAWARLGQLQPIKKLFMQMEEVGVQPNLSSYAACLQCLGRQQVAQPKLVQCILNDIRDHDLDVNKIFFLQDFSVDEWNYIKKAIQWVQPEFEISKPVFELNYDCALVNDLNNVCQPWQNVSSGIVQKAELLKQLEKQLEIELSSSILVNSIEPSVSVTDTIITARQMWDSMKTKWHDTLSSSFAKCRRMEELKTKDHIGFNLVPYLKILDSSTYVDLMVQEIHSLVESDKFSPNTSYLYVTLGYKVYERFLKKCRTDSDYVKKLRTIYTDYLSSFCDPLVSVNHRQAWHQCIQHTSDGKFVEPNEDRWPKHLAKAVGKFLYNIIVADIKFKPENFHKSSEIPAFYSIYRTRNMITEEEIKPHPQLVRMYEMTKQRRLAFDPRELPSLIPPIPWTGSVWGGDLLKTVNIIKNSWNSEEQLEILQQLPRQQMYPVYDALNAVSAIPWTINKKVLDVAIEVFNNGGNMKLALPPPASACPQPKKFSESMSVEEKLERAKYSKLKKEMHSLWCTELYRLSIANKFRDSIFWFPHNIDFRGRAYACPPHFSHIGGDLARSMLLFAQGKPLGVHGLDWLKIHVVNLTGLRKRSTNAERLKFADEMMPFILDSADYPLTGKLWWQQSDEPWQTLAACIEIANAIRSPDPSQYICHYPVHQDGSCNGLQHYAALGRDQIGAQSVNLQPSPAPCDVYSDVVEMIEQERKEDALAGHEIATRLEGFVQRKAVKQTIMTTVYGVTPYGARHQIRGNLGDVHGFPADLAFEASFYLAEKTFHCLQKMFASAKEIQDWLVLSAEVICRLRGRPVEWVTPLGLPVVQPYYDTARLSKPSSNKNTKSFINIRKPNEVKQRNAFPPNFVHSLDSVHFMLTALHCMRAGITFVSVHDCFWTHPSDVAVMGKICREQFVLLHKQPILEELSQLLINKFALPTSDASELTVACEDDDVSDKNNVNKEQQLERCRQTISKVLGHVPKRGDFDLNSILHSTYFFS